MAQYRKDEIEKAIRRAALRVLADKGYPGASIAEIAREAGVSTGNVYRYFEGKDALFDAVLPADLVKTMRRLLRERVLAARAPAPSTSPAAPGAPTGPSHALASEAVVQFCVEHRLEVVVLLGRAAGSRHEGLAAELVRELAQGAVAHFEAAGGRLSVTPALRLTLEHVYRSLLGATVTALATFEDEATIREAIVAYSRYHLAGLTALLGRTEVTA